jgi:hypothetical protein
MPAGQETFERPTGESTPHASYGSARNLLTAFERKFSSN